MSKFITSTVAIVALLTATSLEAANITVTQGSVFARAWDGSGGLAEQTLVATMPMSTASVLTDGTSRNTTTYDFSNSGFRIDVDHARPTTATNNQAQSWHFVPIRFTLDQDEDYSLSGVYSQSGTGRIAYYVELLDVSPGGGVLFRNQQISYNTAGESFTLGLVEGDGSVLENFVGGSLDGTLLAGRTYQLTYNFLIQRWSANSAA